MTPTPQFIQIYQGQTEHIREELLSGLRGPLAGAELRHVVDELWGGRG